MDADSASTGQSFFEKIFGINLSPTGVAVAGDAAGNPRVDILRAEGTPDVISQMFQGALKGLGTGVLTALGKTPYGQSVQQQGVAQQIGSFLMQPFVWVIGILLIGLIFLRR